MDFFSHQDKARTSSLTILALFTVVVTVLFFAVAFGVSILNNIFSLERDVLTLTKTGLFVAGMFWFAIAAGCFFRWLDIRGGSSCLAKRFGAHEIESSTRRDAKKQLHAVTAEMAIAASVPAPTVWVLPHEQSINAFVVGKTNDAAIVVTQAALDELDRDAMRALVAHELGHVVQGDLAINMRMLMVLGGLMALTEIGDMLGDNIGGSIFRIIGGVCVFSGTLIRSAFSRRREFLADAMAVQFTRDPAAVTHCLHTIQAHRDAQALTSPYRHELAHLCFHVPTKRKWFSAKLATHPPLAKRIARIDPNFSPRVAARKRAEERAQAADRNPSNANVTRLSQNSLLHSAIEPANPVSALDDLVTLYLSNPNDALTGVFTLFLTGGSGSSRQSFLNSLAFVFKKPFADKVEKMDKAYGNQLRAQPLRVIEVLGSLLRDKLSIEHRRTLLRHLESLVEIEGETTLMNHAAIALLRRRMQAEHPVLKKQQSSVNSEGGNVLKIPPAVDHRDIGLLLLLLIQASGNTNARNLAEFQRVMRTYTSDNISLATPDDAGVAKRMQQAFDAMVVQPQMVRDTFLQHCAEVVMHDHVVTNDERLLVELFAVSLDARQPEFASADGGGNHLQQAS